MLYLNLALLLILPVLATTIFLYSLKASKTLPNAQLVIDAWNSVAIH